MNKQYRKALVEKVEGDGILQVAIASDASMDRDGEVIAPDGWQLENFLKNPVLLFAHDYRSEPIGKVIAIRSDNGRLYFTPKFAIEHSEKARSIFNLYKDGYMNAFSVGFSPIEWKNGDGAAEPYRTFTKVELLEISAVPVPANPNALVLARSAGMDLEPLGIKDPEHYEFKMPESDPVEPTKPEEPAAPDPAPAAEPEKPAEPAPETAEPTADELKARIAELEGQVTSLRNELDGMKSAQNAGGGAPEKVEQAVEVAVETALDVKRVLQQVDRSVEQALSQLKGIGAARRN